MSLQTPRVSIVVPAYNEARRLPRSLPALTRLAGEGAELIIVDDGSSDDTMAVARAGLGHLPSVSLMRLPRHVGKGAAVRAGVERSAGRSIAYMDADLATDVSCLPGLLAALRHYDVAIGSRSVPGAVIEAARWHRRFGGRLFNNVTQRLTRLPLQDTQCGFKAFRAPVGKLLFGLSRVNGFAFDVEILTVARRLGLRIGQVPVRWIDVNGSHIRPMRDPLIMVRDVALTAARWRERGGPASYALDEADGVIAPFPRASDAEHGAI